MKTEHQNSHIGTYEILKKQGFEEGDIASLARYLDEHQKKGLRPIYWGAGILALLILTAPGALQQIILSAFAQ